jgi:predicted short-subunit dehydrogenase-like oxidoreductase (DUF2520 family)
MAQALQIGIVGAGALATALAHRWQAAGHQIAQVWSRRPDAAQQLAVQVGAQFLIRHSTFDATLDAVLLAVHDKALVEVAAEMAPKASSSTLYLHASGASPLDVLSPIGQNIGVMWPVQSFTRGESVEWLGVPVVVETGALSDEARNVFGTLAIALSGHQVPADSHARQRLHLAAAIANNFTNALIAEAGALIADLGADHRLFLPSIQTIISRLWDHDPARRGDVRSLEVHRALLADRAPDLIPLYNLLTERITQRYANGEQALQ